MRAIQLTNPAVPDAMILTGVGRMEFGTWLGQEAVRLRAGSLWKDCFVDRVGATSVALFAVPRMNVEIPE